MIKTLSFRGHFFAPKKQTGKKLIKTAHTIRLCSTHQNKNSQIKINSQMINGCKRLIDNKLTQGSTFINNNKLLHKSIKVVLQKYQKELKDISQNLEQQSLILNNNQTGLKEQYETLQDIGAKINRISKQIDINQIKYQNIKNSELLDNMNQSIDHKYTNTMNQYVQMRAMLTRDSQLDLILNNALYKHDDILFYNKE